MNYALKVIVNIARLLLAATFLFSGFVKAVDPMGMQYKLQDYLVAMSLYSPAVDDSQWWIIVMAVALALLEFVIGAMLLFAINRRMMTKVTLLFMAVMTALTVWIYIEDPVPDCGCFGDALILTNGQTLAKNIVLLVASVIVARWPLLMPRMVSLKKQWMIFNFSTVAILALSAYSLYYLPPIDFRPYHVGATIGMDSDLFIEVLPSSLGATAGDEAGEDITEQVLTDKGKTLLLIAPYLEQADDGCCGDIDEIYQYAKDNGIPFYCLTASEGKAIEHWIDITGAEYPFCFSDETTLKTIVRSHPGLLLLQNGTIKGKWSHNHLPSLDELK